MGHSLIQSQEENCKGLPRSLYLVENFHIFLGLEGQLNHKALTLLARDSFPFLRTRRENRCRKNPCTHLGSHSTESRMLAPKALLPGEPPVAQQVAPLVQAKFKSRAWKRGFVWVPSGPAHHATSPEGNNRWLGGGSAVGMLSLKRAQTSLRFYQDFFFLSLRDRIARHGGSHL